MQKLRKFFGETSMTWPRVLLLAVLTGAYTALVKIIPLFNDTSVQDIAVYLECWFLFAIFIIVNCKTWWEASLKCFVFFLVSQPLIYLLQVPFASMGWGLFGYYRYWFFVTVLTLPGAAVAFLLKRKDWLSVAVLSVATGYLAWQSATYFDMTAARPPYHLLSAVFCLALIVFFTLVLLEKKPHRVTALALAAAIFAGAMLHNFFPRSFGSCGLLLGEGEWTYTAGSGSIVDVTIGDDGRVTLRGKANGSDLIEFTRGDGTVESYCIVVDGKNIMCDLID